MPRIDAEKPSENPQEVDDEEKDEDFAGGSDGDD